MSRLARVLLMGFAALVFAYLLLPIAVIVPLSLGSQQYLTFPPPGWSTRWYANVLGNQIWIDAAWNSLVIGVPTALLSVTVGTLAALAVVRGGLRWTAVAAAVVLAPMMLPHVILAIGLYPVMLELGLLKSHLAAIIGHSVVAVGIVFVTVSATLRGYTPTLELAAMTLGAGWWRTFRHVTFPMIRLGVLIGGILAFATSFDELMLSLFQTGATTRTLPRLIWEQVNDYLTPAIAAAATLILAVSMVLLGLSALLQSRQPAAR